MVIWRLNFYRGNVWRWPIVILFILGCIDWLILGCIDSFILGCIGWLKWWLLTLARKCDHLQRLDPKHLKGLQPRKFQAMPPKSPIQPLQLLAAHLIRARKLFNFHRFLCFYLLFFQFMWEIKLPVHTTDFIPPSIVYTTQI